MANKPSFLFSYGVAVVATALMLCIRLLLSPLLGEDSPFLILTLAPMLAAFLGGLRPGIVATLLSALAGKLLFVPPYNSLYFSGTSGIVQVLTFLMIGTLISVLKERTRAARQRAEVIAEELKRSREELNVAYEYERRIAQTLQRSLVMKPPPDAFPGLTVELFYQAAFDEAQIGGDFYDAFPLPDGRIALVVGDVSGKGLVAASRTAEVKFALRAFLREIPHPAHTLERLNNFLCDAQETEGRIFGVFVCLALIVLDPRSGEAQVALAGAEPPLVYRGASAPHRGAGDGRTEILDIGGLPLGIDGKVRGGYPTQSVHLGMDDTLLVFTDGLTEARRPHQEILDHTGIERLAREAAPLPSLATMGQSILSGAQDWAGGKLSDDVCLMLVRRR